MNTPTHHAMLFKFFHVVKFLPCIGICFFAEAATWHRIITNDTRYDIIIKGGASGTNWINCNGRYSYSNLVLKPTESIDCEIGTSQSDRQAYTIHSDSCQATAIETFFIQAKNGLRFSLVDGRDVSGGTGQAWPQLKLAHFDNTKIETQLIGINTAISYTSPAILYSYIDCLFCVLKLDNPRPLSEKK